MWESATSVPYRNEMQAESDFTFFMLHDVYCCMLQTVKGS